MNSRIEEMLQFWSELDPERCRITQGEDLPFYSLRINGVWLNLPIVAGIPDYPGAEAVAQTLALILAAATEACRVPTLRLRTESDGQKWFAVLRQVEPELVNFGASDHLGLAVLEALLGWLEHCKRTAAIVKKEES